MTATIKNLEAHYKDIVIPAAQLPICPGCKKPGMLFDCVYENKKLCEDCAAVWDDASQEKKDE